MNWPRATARPVFLAAAKPAFSWYIANGAAELCNYCAGFICGAVVHDDNLKRTIGLRKDALNRFAKDITPVVGWDKNANKSWFARPFADGGDAGGAAEQFSAVVLQRDAPLPVSPILSKYHGNRGAQAFAFAHRRVPNPDFTYGQ